MIKATFRKLSVKSLVFKSRALVNVSQSCTVFGSHTIEHSVLASIRFPHFRYDSIRDKLFVCLNKSMSQFLNCQLPRVSDTRDNFLIWSTAEIMVNGGLLRAETYILTVNVLYRKFRKEENYFRITGFLRDGTYGRKKPECVYARKTEFCPLSDCGISNNCN